MSNLENQEYCLGKTIRALFRQNIDVERPTAGLAGSRFPDVAFPLEGYQMLIDRRPAQADGRNQLVQGRARLVLEQLVEYCLLAISWIVVKEVDAAFMGSK